MCCRSPPRALRCPWRRRREAGPSGSHCDIRRCRAREMVLAGKASACLFAITREDRGRVTNNALARTEHLGRCAADNAAPETSRTRADRPRARRCLRLTLRLVPARPTRRIDVRSGHKSIVPAEMRPTCCAALGDAAGAWPDGAPVLRTVAKIPRSLEAARTRTGTMRNCAGSRSGNALRSIRRFDPSAQGCAIRSIRPLEAQQLQRMSALCSEPG